MAKDTDDQRAARDETVALADRALGGPLRAVEVLGGSPRSVVCRGRASAESVVPAGTSVVVKRFVDNPVPPEFTRELTGLRHLERTPTLLACDPENGLLVMSDLGNGPTLADLLLGDDPRAAADGARSWARSLGDLVGASAPSVPAIVEDLREQDEGENPEVPGWQLLSDGVHRLRELVGTPANGSGPAVLATCWCVFDPPPGLTDEMYAAFTAGLRRHVPAVLAEPAWSRQVDLAAAAWILLTSGLLVRRARDEGHRRIGPEGRPAPTGRQLLAARWRWGARQLAGTVPAIAELCAGAADWADRTWGPDAAPIGPYAAFA